MRSIVCLSVSVAREGGWALSGWKSVESKEGMSEDHSMALIYLGRWREGGSHSGCSECWGVTAGAQMI